MAKTNGDHIRTLSDKDIASLLLSADSGDFTVDICNSAYAADADHCPGTCDGCALRFVQAPFDEQLWKDLLPQERS